MGVKYTLPYVAHDGINWRVDISIANYNADPIVVKGQSEQAAVCAWESENGDDPFSVTLASTLDVNFINEGQVDMQELRGAQDMEFTATWYKAGNVFWTGYLKNEGIRQTFQSFPYPTTISFMCGLSMLDDIPYTHAALPGLTSAVSNCPMNYIRQILFAASNLGLALPIRWSNGLQCTAFTDDIFAGSVQWSPFGEGYLNYSPAKTCGYILKGILRSQQCQIKQSGGKWIIRRINDLVTNNIAYKEIPATLGRINYSSSTENLLANIGRIGYRMTREDHSLITKPGIKSFTATYKANTKDNKLPNGNQDIVVAGKPLYWGTYDGSEMEITSVDPLDGRAGNATQLFNNDFFIDAPDKYFTLIYPGGTLKSNGLPIDAYTLVTTINFGFIFVPKLEFPDSPSNPGIIDWSGKPLQIMLVLNMGLIRYYLNEFGFWVTEETFISIEIDGLALDDVAKVDFDKFQGIKIPQPPTQPGAGDTCDLQIIFKVKPRQKYIVDSIYINIEEADDVYEVTATGSKNTLTDETSLDISSSFGGYMVSNFMSAYYNSDIECEYLDGLFYTGTLTGVMAHAAMRLRYRSSDIFGGTINTKNTDWTVDQVYTIDSLPGKKFISLNVRFNSEKCEAEMLSVFEIRNDNVALTEKFYSSNDSSNSN